MPKPKFTDQEKRVIPVLPDGWFKADELSHEFLARGGICERLKKKGVLESRIPPEAWELLVKGIDTHWETEYRKTT